MRAKAVSAPARIAVPLLAALLASSACNGANAVAAPATPGRCPGNERALAATGLCQQQAAALLPNGGAAAPGAQPGCRWVIRETAFAGDMLLYRTLRCGKAETAVELRVGNHMSELTYTRRADGGAVTDADGKPLVLARIFAGMPGGRARALWETRDSIADAQAASRCELSAPYQAEGLPGDALIVDVKRSQADLERDDAVPECGPFGYNPAGGSIEFWRPHQGYAWFFSLGTDVWDVDPGSFTLVRKDPAGTWTAVPEPS